jgi:hypothetical protein
MISTNDDKLQLVWGFSIAKPLPNTFRLSPKQRNNVGWVVRVSVAKQWNETQHLQGLVGFSHGKPNLQKSLTEQY